MKKCLKCNGENFKAVIKKGAIVIENVVFGYNAGKTVFDNLNLVIEAGHQTGIVGASGAVMRLSFRFRAPRGAGGRRSAGRARPDRHAGARRRGFLR